MCFLSIFERLHLMRLRPTILSVFYYDFVTGRLLSVRRKSGQLIIHWLWQPNVMSTQAPKVECTYGAAGVSRPGRVTVQGPEKSDQERVCVVALWVYSAVYVCVDVHYYRLLSLSWPSERGSAYTLSHAARSSPSSNIWMRHLTVNRARHQHVFHRHLQNQAYFWSVIDDKDDAFWPNKGKEVIRRTIDDQIFRRTCFLYIPFKRNVEAQLSISWLVLIQKLWSWCRSAGNTIRNNSRTKC